MEQLRIDKWLWAARFFKTRSMATDDINKGRVQINGQDVKPAREVRTGDTVAVRQGVLVRTVTVLAISDKRGPASVAQSLYAETPESIDLRQQLAEQRRLAPEPALSLEHGRPTKRERRDLQRSPTWDDRWSASIED